LDINSEETASAVYAGIKYPMSVGDSRAVQRELLDIKESVKDIDIYICDERRAIKFSTDKTAVTAALDHRLPNKAAISALESALKSGVSPAGGFSEKSGGRTYLIHIHAILNEDGCFRCHGSGKKVLGAIVSRKSTDRNYAAIANMRNSSLIITILGIFAIIAIAHALLVRLVSQPLKALVKDIKRLPEQISRADFISGSANAREDQIGILQKSFSDMAVEIYEKNHAIEKSNLDLANAYTELEAFAYSVSHDLRAPLRNIDGFSKILLDEYSEKLDDRAKHYLKRVRNGTERMSLLIDDMLAFSRVGRAELQFKRIDCADLIKPILEYYIPEIEKRKATVILQKLPEINCDPVLMQSTFANLISNAFKYSRNAEKPEIVIGYDRDREAIFVKDNGVGFEIRYHDKVFQVFQRLHLPEEYEGTGIGLAIVKKIVERHHGRIWAEAEPGKGAAFYIDLPIFTEV
jgi:signal transduction histidine kinase